MKIRNLKTSLLAAVPVSVLVAAPAWAQNATDALDELQGDGTDILIKLAKMVGALAVLVIGYKVIPAALTAVLAYIRK